MKHTIFILFLLPGYLAAQPDYSIYLEKANGSADFCEEFLEIMTEQKDESSTAMGYYALATMLQAKRYPNPFTKLSYFNKGKKILEETIENNPDNVELRFLRFAVQTEVPGILLYFNEIEEDQGYLDTHLKQSNDRLASRIQKYYSLKDIAIES